MMAEIPTRYRARERARACRAQGLRRARPGRASHRVCRDLRAVFEVEQRNITPYVLDIVKSYQSIMNPCCRHVAMRLASRLARRDRHARALNGLTHHHHTAGAAHARA